MNKQSQLFLEDAIAKLAPIRAQLMDHPVYEAIENADDLQVFMKHHVFAVWDFMSLLKTLQVNLTCVSVPWLPPKHPVAARLINEIVLAEESDALGDDTYASHFDLYISAMRQCGADAAPIQEFIRHLEAGADVRQSLNVPSIPRSAQNFVNGTFDFIDSGKIWTVASAFTFGREEIIPDMFRNFDIKSSQALAENFSTLIKYLELHIITDEHHHVPLAFRLLNALCQDDGNRWNEVIDAAKLAITRRIELWDGVLDELNQKDRNLHLSAFFSSAGALSR